MEDFITDIYQDSFIIENLKEFIFLSNSGCTLAARSLYNKTAIALEDYLNKIAKTDASQANMIQSIALEIKDSYDKTGNIMGLIEGQLIPALYSSMQAINCINVSEGDYSIKSSDTGFLTVKNNRINLYLHSTHDPMWEAHQIAQSLYRPEMEHFFILGCGLGYLAYQIFHQSDGATKIHIYENDERIINYAFLYGVLSLIPDDNIDIIHSDSRNDLANKLVKDLNNTQSFGLYFSLEKKLSFSEQCNTELNRIIINHELSREVHRLSITNLWKNQKLSHINFSSILNKFDYNEWIVISAGPSFDDNISFLKKNMGKRGLIAVNTVLRRLVSEKIKPDIIAAADQFPDLINHIKGLEDYTENIVLVADWLLNWKYSSLYRGPICFMRTNASASATQNSIPHEPIWDISGTVAALAIEVAVHLNASRIYLVGQDLAYPSGQRYAKGMPQPEIINAKGELHVPSVDGGMVGTCEAFDWFRKSLEYQIEKYKQIEFINLSKHGALIKGALAPSSRLQD